MPLTMRHVQPTADSLRATRGNHGLATVTGRTGSWRSHFLNCAEAELGRPGQHTPPSTHTTRRVCATPDWPAASAAGAAAEAALLDGSGRTPPPAATVSPAEAAATSAAPALPPRLWWWLCFCRFKFPWCPPPADPPPPPPAGGGDTSRPAAPSASASAATAAGALSSAEPEAEAPRPFPTPMRRCRSSTAQPCLELSKSLLRSDPKLPPALAPALTSCGSDAMGANVCATAAAAGVGACPRACTGQQRQREASHVAVTVVEWLRTPLPLKPLPPSFPPTDNPP
jgi:hypothetical protein